MKRSAAPPPPPPPLPPGRVGADVLLPTSKKKAKVTTTPKTASPAPKDPEHVKDDAKLKNWWQQGTKRRNQKMRSIEHWLRFNQPNFMNMAVCDFPKQAVPPQESPSFHFRNEARKFEVIRYFVFLYQMVLLLIRVWRPTRWQVEHYGMGVDTPARRALVMIHSGLLPAESISQLKSVKRHLYGRAAKKTENLNEFNAVAEAEADSDMVMSISFRILDHIEDVMLPAVLNGKFPKLNPDFDSLAQYEDCWEVLLVYILQVRCSVLIVCVNSFHGCKCSVLGE